MLYQSLLSLLVLSLALTSGIEQAAVADNEVDTAADNALANEGEYDDLYADDGDNDELNEGDAAQEVLDAEDGDEEDHNAALFGFFKKVRQGVRNWWNRVRGRNRKTTTTTPTTTTPAPDDVYDYEIYQANEEEANMDDDMDDIADAAQSDFDEAEQDEQDEEDEQDEDEDELDEQETVPIAAAQPSFLAAHSATIAMATFVVSLAMLLLVVCLRFCGRASATTAAYSQVKFTDSEDETLTTYA